jgi:hypothetical protein
VARCNLETGRCKIGDLLVAARSIKTEDHPLRLPFAFRKGESILQI